MAIRTPICETLGIDHPIILGGMMGISDANLTATIACRNSSPTRMVKNEFFAEMDALDEPGKKAMDFFPVQQMGSKRIPDDVDGTKGSYAAGTGSGLVREIKPAGDIVREIIEEAEEAMVFVRHAFAG